MKYLLFLVLLPQMVFCQPFGNKEIMGYRQQALRVKIIRDNWGIPHIYGHSDADAVFGLLYAQCEDDFKRVEMNYIEKLGRISEIKGPSELYNDMLIRMVIDSASAIKDYQRAPAWLKKLLDAYAGGINYYLITHPMVKPALLNRFKPWYPLLWTDGSIGAINVSSITTADLKAFYGEGGPELAQIPLKEDLPSGSNGFALGPAKTASGHAMLYINPHVTFYFRPEVHVISRQGLNAYGAVTWGQFFIYQGFNEHCGWMHTSGYTDVADLYREKIIHKGSSVFYDYDGKLRPVKQEKLVLRYLSADHSIRSKTWVIYRTHHGPVMAKRENDWVSVKSNNRSMTGLMQSWLRTKSRTFQEYKSIMNLRANTSNNTVYADDSGNIAYWHGNFIPKRSLQFDWSKPVDGTTSATEWMGLHRLDETIHLYNPPGGWIQNCNSTPFTAAGINSPRREDYPAYMAPDGQNFRGLNAARLLAAGTGYTLDKLIATGYNTHLSAFDVLLPAFLDKDNNHNQDSSYEALKAPLELLRLWDHAASDTSTATTLAILWAERLLPSILKEPTGQQDADIVAKTTHFSKHAKTGPLLDSLRQTMADLQRRFGNWLVPWGTINRYQRITGHLQETYDDTQSSLPVGFAASTWGCLPSFVSRPFSGSNLRYGYNGNSFICAVEFGKRVSAKSLLAGGQSGDPLSPHFSDQAAMYTRGIFKDVLFYREDVLKHAEKQYYPGQ